VFADEEFEQDQLEELITQFAEGLLTDDSFIYKGMENFAKVNFCPSFSSVQYLRLSTMR
jgi:hypothetical protein